MRENKPMEWRNWVLAAPITGSIIADLMLDDDEEDEED